MFRYFCIRLGTFNTDLERLQPHLRMPFVKTITTAWHTSSRMHEAVSLPCIFGCNAFSAFTIALPASVDRDRNIRDETAHYSVVQFWQGLFLVLATSIPFLTCMTLFMEVMRAILLVR